VDLEAKEMSSWLAVELQQMSTHQQTVLTEHLFLTTRLSKGNWDAGAKATLELMQQGVDYKGVPRSYLF